MLYDACLRRTLAAAPHEIANWPDAVLQSEAARWLEQDYDLYLLSELAEHADLQLPQPRVEFHLYRALETGRVDDFCFLHKRMGPVLTLDRGRLTAGCVRLAITGNVGGLEAVVAVTGVEVRLTESEALQAYDALAVMGRPAAMEYVRQLSGTPIACAEANAQAGYRLLLMTGNYERLSELRRVTGVVPELDKAELDSRCGSLEAALQFRELRRLVEATGTVVRFDGFAARAGALMVDGDVLELPALFALCGDARPDDVPIEALGLLATSDDCDAVSFLYDTSGFAPTRLLFADVAYATAAGAQDWRLARRVCEASDRTPDPEHREPMLEAALSTTDPFWVLRLPEVLGPSSHTRHISTNCRCDATLPN